MQLKKEMIRLNQKFLNKEDAIRAVGQLLVDNGNVDATYVEAMLNREKIVTTYMGNFIAIPHGTDESKQQVHSTGISVIQVPYGVDFSIDDSEEKMAMLVFGIAGIGDEHLELLSNIAVICSDVNNVVRLVNAKSEEEIIKIFEGEKQ